MTDPLPGSTDRNDGPTPPEAGVPLPVWLLVIAAVALRLILLLGRGDYLAFDEGWYLLLARSLFTGDGYSLVGFPHTTLSPLFPVLAGGVGTLVDSWVWGGRIVAALASGLVVLPAWAIFRRLTAERTALIAGGIVAVLPSLAPFVVPFWIGADLWVGAEPLLHLFLYTGVALWLRAARPGEDDASEPILPYLIPWLVTGATFGLAFLARPEAIIAWALLGVVALALAAVARSPRRLYGAALMGVGFVLVAAPFWLYLHDVSGQWSLTGRGVSLPTVAMAAGGGRSSASRTIERMLWEDDQAYRERLYGLDESGLRLRSDYWGVPPESPADRAPTPVDTAAGPTERAGAAGAGPGGGATEPGLTGEDPGPQAPGPVAAPPDTRTSRDPPSPLALYLQAMGMILPLLLWPFVVLGAARPRGRGILRRELPIAGALLGTSIGIAVVVAVDPRTQLFLVPFLALYVARGFSLVEEAVQTRLEGVLRPGFVELLLAGTAVVWLLGINARRLYLSVSLGSPHHIVAEQNRAVAEELDALLGTDDGPVASWHPALAVYADRDWRVLPFADLPDIVRYEDAAGAEAMVLSAYYPPDLGVENLGTRYLVLPVPETEGRSRPWRLHLVRGDTIRALGRLEPFEPEDAESDEGS